MGLLSFNGSIDLNQFWPQGQSDGDTVHITIQSPFTFEQYPGSSLETTVFEDASVGGKKVIRNGSLTIRLQGIDTTELHYSPQPPEFLHLTSAQRRRFNGLNKNFRQYLAETAAVGFHDLLRQVGSSAVPCTVTSLVDTPNEVFDLYGRFIGVILVKTGDSEVNINRRLVEEGLAFPTFYSSMSSQEIQELLDATQSAREARKGVWGYYQFAIGKLDISLVYRDARHHPQFDASKDVGPVIFPKLFRRLCAYTVLYQARIFSRSFKQYMERLDKEDQCFLTEDFLLQGPTASPVYSLSEFISDDQEFDIPPEELIFQEKPSELVDPAGNIISSW